MAQLNCHTVAIIFDEAWRDSFWACGEWQLFLKNSLEQYATCYGKAKKKLEQTKSVYQFKLVVIYHADRDGDEGATRDELQRTLQALSVSDEMMRDASFIPVDVKSFHQHPDARLTPDAEQAFIDAICESSKVALREQAEFAAKYSRAELTRLKRNATKQLYDKDWRELALAGSNA